MRYRTRYLLAITLLATTLCVDRPAVAAAKVDAVVSRTLVDRLTDGFRRSVATRPVVRQRCPLATKAVPPTPVVAIRTTAVAPPPACPAHLPLPPPTA